MQTAYKSRPAAYLLGLATGTADEGITLIPTEVIPFGRATKRAGTDGQQVVNIAAGGTTDVVVGVSVRKHNETGQYEISEEATIMTKGVVAVEVLGTDTVKAGDSAFMIVDAGADFGKFTKTAGVNTVAFGAVFQGLKDGNLAEIKFDVVA